MAGNFNLVKFQFGKSLYNGCLYHDYHVNYFLAEANNQITKKKHNTSPLMITLKSELGVTVYVEWHLHRSGNGEGRKGCLWFRFLRLNAIQIYPEVNRPSQVIHLCWICFPVSCFLDLMWADGGRDLPGSSMFSPWEECPYVSQTWIVWLINKQCCWAQKRVQICFFCLQSGTLLGQGC